MRSAPLGKGFWYGDDQPLFAAFVKGRRGIAAMAGLSRAAKLAWPWL
jgi:hypothetical protein